LDTEVNNLLAAGITTVVAAGNDNAPACSQSPARVPGALTVGASNSLDQRAPYSNFGQCVDLFAPGSGITSDWIGSTTATSVSSGTSESAPMAAGVAALILERFPSASPATVSQTIVSQATDGVLNPLNIGDGSPNLLLYSGIDALNTTAADGQLLG